MPMTERPVSVFRLAAPSSEIVTLAEAKAQLRVTHDAEDAHIAALIEAAREAVEEFTRRSLVRCTWRAEYECLDGIPATLRLPRPPYHGEAVVKFRDDDGFEFAASASSFFVARDAGGAVLGFREISPLASRAHPHPVAVEWSAGDPTPGARAKQAVLLMLSNLYENRTPVVTGATANEIPFTLRALMDSLRVRMI